MAITGVSHVSVYVRDQEQALDFYTNLLGFTVRRNEPYEGDVRWIEVVPPGAPTALVLTKGEHPAGPEQQGPNTGMILAADDVRQTIEELRARGVTIAMEPQSFPWGTNAMIADPDGNSFVVGGP